MAVIIPARILKSRLWFLNIYITIASDTRSWMKQDEL